MKNYLPFLQTIPEKRYCEEPSHFMANILKELTSCEARCLHRGNPLFLKYFLDCFVKNTRNDENEVLWEQFSHCAANTLEELFLLVIAGLCQRFFKKRRLKPAATSYYKPMMTHKMVFCTIMQGYWND